MSNPFSLAFGIEPINYIDRINDRDKIINDFSSENPANYVYLITGIRGSGKTVFMYSIADKLKNKNDWIVANIGHKKNILEGVASEIYEQGKMKYLFTKKEFSFSFYGVTFSISGKEPVSDIMTLLKKMLEYLKRKQKKVLITIDEVDNSDEMKYFIQGYASLLGQKYPMRLLMTGLFSNIANLKNEKSLTFLYRAPKIQMGSLSIGSIAKQYSLLLNVEENDAIQLAKFTKGYAYAYQVLGYYLYELNKKKIDEQIMYYFDQQLEEFVYEKVYSELSDINQFILRAVDSDEKIKVSTLSKKLDKKSNYLSVYLTNLKNKGILVSPSYGYIQFALPRFYYFLKTK